MAPDLNSLPPSKSTTHPTPLSHNMHSASLPVRQDSSSPRGSTSLAAAASMNAAEHPRNSPQSHRLSSDRRRSQVLNTLSLNDPTTPSLGEMASSEHRTSIGHTFSAASPQVLGGRGTISTGDPHHQRQPSLGDIHNELEQEQEAQVNRMLQMIRQQQTQLDTLQRSNTESTSTSDRPRADSHANTTAIVDVPTPGSERSFSFQPRPRSISRNPSSANRSPALRPMPSHDGQHTLFSNSSEWIPPSSPLDSSARRNSNRDESAYYQAETANLTRENQMLKLRIRELEKQLVESTGSNVNSPALPSNLVSSPVVEGTT